MSLKEEVVMASMLQKLEDSIPRLFKSLDAIEKDCEDKRQRLAGEEDVPDTDVNRLIECHQKLFRRYDNILKAVHHPVAKPYVRQNATSVPKRLWLNAVFPLLELLRQSLPSTSAAMMLFQEIVCTRLERLAREYNGYKLEWLEMLGDVTRYRRATADELAMRKHWTVVARKWYNKAVDLSPYCGRLQHHLGVLAEPDVLGKLFYYSKSLTSVVPFTAANKTIGQCLFAGIVDATVHKEDATFEELFVTAVAILYEHGSVKVLESALRRCNDLFEDYLTHSANLHIQGPQIVSILFSMLVGFGKSESTIWRLLLRHQSSLKRRFQEVHRVSGEEIGDRILIIDDPDTINTASQLYWSSAASRTDSGLIGKPDFAKDRLISCDDVSTFAGLMLKELITAIVRAGNIKVAAVFLYTILVYLCGLIRVPHVLIGVEACIPWLEVADFLNGITTAEMADMNPVDATNQLPEDFAIRGSFVSHYFFSGEYFEGQVPEHERFEQPNHHQQRLRRCLAMGTELAKLDLWLTYDPARRLFRGGDRARV